MRLNLADCAGSDRPIRQVAGDVINLDFNGVTCSCAKVRDYTELLGPRESRAVSSAVGKRRCEFSTGRWLARLQFERLGIETCEVPVGSLRRPIWPNGVVGSVAHTDELAAVAVARDQDFIGVGIDLEQEGRLESDLRPMVLSASETKRYRHLDGTLIFSAKEACYKLLNPITGSFVDFLDIEIDICEPSRSFSARYLGPALPNILVKEAQGRFDNICGQWLTAITLPLSSHFPPHSQADGAVDPEAPINA